MTQQYDHPVPQHAPPTTTSLAQHGRGADSLADVLDRVLDKGVVIAGDIRISLLDIELLTIKLRLLIASADKAKELGIDWWAHDPELSSNAQKRKQLDANRENEALRRRVEQLESRLGALLTSNGRDAERRPAARGKT